MSNTQESRGAKALRAAQEARTSEIWQKVRSILSSHRCVTFGFSIEWDEEDNETDCAWSESMPAAVELLQIATGSAVLVDGELISNRRALWAAKEIQRAASAVEECASLVQHIHLPSVLLVHVPGQLEIGVYFNGKHGKYLSFSSLAADLALSVQVMAMWSRPIEVAAAP